MNKETIVERINKATENISKKEGTLAKHQKGAEKLLKVITEHGWNPEDKYCRYETPEHHDAYWTICDYTNKLDDIKRTENTIRELKESLQNYQEMLQQEIEKENSRNVTVIIEFLEAWKTRNIEFFLEQKVKYEEALVEHHEEERRVKEEMNSLGYRASWCKEDPNHEKYNELYKNLRQIRQMFQSRWLHVTQFDHGSKDWETTMRTTLEREKNRKYDFIIERTNRIVGQITDASNLSIGQKSDLNGYIIGTKGIANVKTIGAGGYNIQCFHFRTLINKF